MNVLSTQAGFSASDQPDDFTKDAAVYKTLLESTRAIPWKIDWDTMCFAYIGPQIEELLGWPQDSWRTVDDWATRMHADDRDYVVNFCVSQSQAGVDHEADYRALTSDGSHVWIRDVVHVVRREDGSVDSLIGFMFDISERKKAEDQVLRLQKELEKLSFTDGLTGIANRRLFDNHFASEWKQSVASGKPLSVILLDIDCFKQYNDFYGHIAGDECLRRVAQTLATTCDDAASTVARFGGEEFALLLPNTDADAARAIAEECIAAIAALTMPHEGSTVGKHVTASLGLASGVCRDEMAPRTVLERVDQLLYQAKRNGRNRIEISQF